MESEQLLILEFIRGPPGDLFVYLDVEEVAGIQRDGINLSSSVSISYLDAILGASVKASQSVFVFVFFSFYSVVH